MADIQRGQLSASAEHFGHVGDFGRIERADIQRSQTLAVGEHRLHACHLAGFEVAEVDGLQLVAPAKHILHGGNIAGIKVAEAADGFQLRAAIEQVIQLRAVIIFTACVYDGSSDIIAEGAVP